jgi:hypothetical protein
MLKNKVLKKKIALGIDDFKEVIKENVYFVDIKYVNK